MKETKQKIAAKAAEAARGKGLLNEDSLAKLQRVEDSEFDNLKKSLEGDIKQSKESLRVIGMCSIIPLILETFFLIATFFIGKNIKILHGFFIFFAGIIGLCILGFTLMALYELRNILTVRRFIKDLWGDGTLKLLAITEEKTQEQKDFEWKTGQRGKFWNKWEKYNCPKRNLNLPNGGFEVSARDNFIQRCGDGEIRPEINKDTFEIEGFTVKFKIGDSSSNTSIGTYKTIGIFLNNDYNLLYIFYNDGTNEKCFSLDNNDNNENNDYPEVVKNFIAYIGSFVIVGYKNIIRIEEKEGTKVITYKQFEFPIEGDIGEQPEDVKAAVDHLRVLRNSSSKDREIIPGPIELSEKTPKLDADGQPITKLRFIREEVKSHVQDMKSEIDTEKRRYKAPIEKPTHEHELILTIRKPKFLNFTLHSSMKHRVKVLRTNPTSG